MPNTTSTYSPDELKSIYQEALAEFVAKLKQDRYIIAAILYGSLASGLVWEKSDIDILLVSREDKIQHRYYSLLENGVSIQVFMSTRSSFRAMVESALQGSFNHAMIAHSILLFSSDESIKEYYQNAPQVGNRDRAYQMLNVVSRILPVLTKAEKWLEAKKDSSYSFLWFAQLINPLASIEVLLQHAVPGREAIWQALDYNPTFFKLVYLDLIQQPKDERKMLQVIQLVYEYLDQKARLLFQPILAYLASAGGVRSTTEINTFLETKLQLEGQDFERMAFAYEWLAQKQIITRVTLPLRLTEKSRTTVNEAAYYFDGEDLDETDNCD